MIEALPLGTGFLALPDLSQVFYIGVRVLMVAAGALLGWLAGGPIVRVLIRLAFQRPAPKPALILSRIGCAILFGFLVYLIPIGGGSGSGLGGKGRDKGGDKKGEKDQPAADKPGRDSKEKDKTDTVLSVQVLGGEAVIDNRFFLIISNGKNKTLTRDDLRKIIEKDQTGPRRYTRLDIHWDENSVLPTSEVVKRLEELGLKHKLDVRTIRDSLPVDGKKPGDKD